MGEPGWHRRGRRTWTVAEAFGLAYRLNLYSNFTYFLDDPIDGDQFEQADRRVVGGAGMAHRRLASWSGRDVEHLFGLQLRSDVIPEVALHRTRARERRAVVRESHIVQHSVAAHGRTAAHWTRWLRVVAGLRADLYTFEVDDRDPANSGRRRAAQLGPKLSLVLGPWRRTEVYLNFGDGFHSNDGRGTTTTRDPATREPVLRADPLTRARGAELGVRTTALRNVHATFTLWGLDLDSELVFVGDAGTTDAARASRRLGAEWTSYVALAHGLVLDADLAWSRARFRTGDASGHRVPGAIEGVASAGVTVEDVGGFSCSLRLRYFGPRPLVEDDSVWAKASTVLNARLQYRLSSRYSISADVFNLADARVSDIDYFYPSRLPGEPADGVADVHTHPLERRSLRIGLSATF